MLDRMQIERMCQRLHGADCSLKLLSENDRALNLELEIVDFTFTITRQRDVSTGAYVDRLTIKLDTQAKIDAYQKTSVIDLRIVDRTTRYRLDAKAMTPQIESMFGYAECVMMQNERTAIA